MLDMLPANSSWFQLKIQLANNSRWTWMGTDDWGRYDISTRLSSQLRVQEVTRLLPLCLSVTVERKRLHTPDLPRPCNPHTHTLAASSLWLHHHTDLWAPNKRLKQLADKWRSRRSNCTGGWGGWMKTSFWHWHVRGSPDLCSAPRVRGSPVRLVPLWDVLRCIIVARYSTKKYYSISVKSNLCNCQQCLFPLP